MKYRLTLFLFSFVVVIYSCRSANGKKEYRGVPIPPVIVSSTEKEHHGAERKYDVKSGEIIYETALNTISVHMKYKTIVYFDNYGMKERRDTYRGDTLTESYLSDGKNTYRINHKKKQAFFSGKAYKGTEPKFGWAEIGEEDKKSGKVKLAPEEMIAGKKCMVYTVKSGAVTAKYAGWEGINLLSEIKSPGGTSITIAMRITLEDIQAARFEVPKGYKVS